MQFKRKIQTGSEIPGSFFLRPLSRGIVNLLLDVADMQQKPEDNEPKKLTPIVLIKGIGESLQEMFVNLMGPAKRFEELTAEEKEGYFERLSITACVAVACISSGFFYWLLPPIFRVLVVPILIGLAWWAGAKLVPQLLSEEGRQHLLQHLNAVELFQLIEAVKFTAITCVFAAVPIWSFPLQFEVALRDPFARTLFLCMFTWNLIGAPLYAQAKSGNARLIIILIFGVPAATVTLWWAHFLTLLDKLHL